MRVPSDDNSVVTRPRASQGVASLVVCTAACLVVACLVVVALLGAGVRSRFAPQLRLDAAVSDALYVGDHRAAALDWFLKVLTAPGSSWFRFVVFLPVLVLLLRRRAWWTALWVAVTIVGIAPLTTLLKDFFGRVRPEYAQGGARLDTLSFPSGHSSGIATLVTVGLLLAWPLLSPRARRWWVLAGVALVLVVGLTRIWLGVHYPSDVLAGWALGVAWALLTALVFGALPGGRAALRPGSVSGLDQRVVLANDDGSLGPLLRVADDRLGPQGGYGRHEHRAVDVVAVVLVGSLWHRWSDEVLIAAGDVAVLTAGAGLDHDEVAGNDGVRVLQCYLRSAAPAGPPTHEVHRAASGWVDLGRGDARLWVARPEPGETVAPPAGLLLVAGDDGVSARSQSGEAFPAPGGSVLLVWQLDRTRPAWAQG